MSVEWFHYHSAFELVVGVNLAIFALPNLREPAIHAEADRWVRLLRLIPPDHDEFVPSREGARSFALVRRELEKQTDVVRFACLVVVAVCAGFLYWGTAVADDVPTYPCVIWFVIALSWMPVIVLCGLDVAARCRLAESSRTRRSLENKALAG
jgi:hypothetical protein